MSFSLRKILITVAAMLVLSASNVNAINLEFPSGIQPVVAQFHNQGYGGIGSWIGEYSRQQEAERKKKAIILGVSVALFLFSIFGIIAHLSKASDKRHNELILQLEKMKEERAKEKD